MIRLIGNSVARLTSGFWAVVWRFAARRNRVASHRAGRQISVHEQFVFGEAELRGGTLRAVRRFAFSPGLRADASTPEAIPEKGDRHPLFVGLIAEEPEPIYSFHCPQRVIVGVKVNYSHVDPDRYLQAVNGSVWNNNRCLG